jgi:hypothetical protein
VSSAKPARYRRFASRIVASLIVTAITFVVVAVLPLAVSWFRYGDPGDIGGAAILTIGVVWAIVSAPAVLLLSLWWLKPGLVGSSVAARLLAEPTEKKDRPDDSRNCQPEQDVDIPKV